METFVLNGNTTADRDFNFGFSLNPYNFNWDYVREKATEQDKDKRKVTIAYNEFDAKALIEMYDKFKNKGFKFIMSLKTDKLFFIESEMYLSKK